MTDSNKIFVSEDWIDWEAQQLFYKIRKKLPKEFTALDRMGCFIYSEVNGIEGEQPCLKPIQGYLKLISPKSHIRLFNPQGEQFYLGTWINLDPKVIPSDGKFYLFLTPRHNAKEKIDLWLRLQGFIKLIHHRMFKK